MSEEYRCVKCKHLESEHEEDDKGQCLAENCNCDGLESEVVEIDSCPDCYKKGRKKGIVIGAIAVLFLMTIAHAFANGIMYWK